MHGSDRIFGHGDQLDGGPPDGHLGGPPAPASGAPQSLRESAAWVFDLDNTLYSARFDLFDQIDVRMRTYIAAFLGVPVDDAHRLQKQYFTEFGMSLSGLMRLHRMDPKPFLERVHDIDLSVLPPCPELDAALADLPGRKIIYTNASTRHAERVIERLGVAHHIEAVFDIVEANYQPKPEPAAYDMIVKRHGLDPRTTVMVEDMARNLMPAALLGMTTVWVRTESDFGCAGRDAVRIDYEVEDLVAWLRQVAGGGPTPTADL